MWDDFPRYNVDLTHLRLALGEVVPVLLQEKVGPDVTLEEYTNLREHLNRLSARTNLFCLGITGARVPARFMQRIADDPADDFAILDADFIKRYTACADLTSRFAILTKALLEQVGVVKLSPYALDVPATGGRFFGREAVLRKLLDRKDTSFTIVGPRRIGKTSLLRQVLRWIERRNPEENTLRTGWVTCTKYKNTLDVVSDILRAFYESGTEREALRLDVRPSRIHSFPNVIARMARRHSRVALFIDEVDYIVEMDERQGYECLSLLKSAFDNENCQVFFAGFRAASRARSDIRSPLYGFTQFEELKPLTMPESRDMVRRPFQNLGLGLSDLVVQAIAEESAGHPQVITMFCDTLVNLYSTNKKMPSDAEIKRDIFNSQEFRKKVMDTFTMNTNEYEELFCLLLMREALKRPDDVGQFEFGFEKINGLLRGVGIELEVRGIATICNSLRLSSIFMPTDRPNMFVFSIPQLVHFFSRYNLDWYIDKAARTLRTAQTNWQAVYSEADVAVADRLFVKGPS
jgi:AAA domain